MALSCNQIPHFTTIANFISSLSEEIEPLFEQVLLVCEEEGLLGKELFALDGCKISSNASKEWSGTFKELAQKRDKIKRRIRYHIDEHQKCDKNNVDDQQHLQREQQTIDTLEKAAEKIDYFLNTHEPRIGKGKLKKEVKSNITDIESAKMTTSKGTIQGYNAVSAVDKKHQVIVDAQAFGEGAEQQTLQPVTDKIQERFKRLGISENIFAEKINSSDSASEKNHKQKETPVLTADTGFSSEANFRYLHHNGINGIIPDNKFRSRDPKFSEQKIKYGKRHQDKKKKYDIIPSSEFNFDPITNTCVCPAGEKVPLRSETIDKQGKRRLRFEGRLSSCRNCHLKIKCMRNPSSADHRKGHGRQVSFALTPGKPSPYTEWMKRRVDSKNGKIIYSHRMSVVEPVFGNLTFNKKLTQFSLRGKKKVDTQWKLFCMVHNIEKLSNFGKMAV